METLLEFSEDVWEAIGYAALFGLLSLWWSIAKLMRAHREKRNNKLSTDHDVTGERLGRYSDSAGVDPDDE